MFLLKADLFQLSKFNCNQGNNQLLHSQFNTDFQIKAEMLHILNKVCPHEPIFTTITPVQCLAEQPHMICWILVQGAQLGD